MVETRIIGMLTQGNCLCRIKYNADPNDAIMVTIEKNKQIRPEISFVGKETRKSCSALHAVRIPRNIKTEVVELNIDIAFETIRNKNARSLFPTA